MTVTSPGGVPGGGAAGSVEWADEVWVEQDGRVLTGVDATTGQEIWTFEAPSEDLDFAVRHGTVVVTHDPAPRKRLVEVADQDAQEMITVLDARTGDTTGRLTVLKENRIPDLVGIAPGRAFFSSRDGSGVLGR